MDANYWKEKWEVGDIRFHRDEAHPQLVAHFSHVKPQKVMVPLCGKSNDLIWLRAHGHEVVGIELSPIACEAFFEENKIRVKKTPVPGGTLYHGDNLSIWCCDLFESPAEAWAGCTALYDRAALVALPPELRRKYSEHVTRSWKKAPSQFMLLITFEYQSDTPVGPPFPVFKNEVAELYGKHFSILTVTAERDESLSDCPPKFTGIDVTERTYALTPLA